MVAGYLELRDGWRAVAAGQSRHAEICFKMFGHRPRGKMAQRLQKPKDRSFEGQQRRAVQFGSQRQGIRHRRSAQRFTQSRSLYGRPQCARNYPRGRKSHEGHDSAGSPRHRGQIRHLSGNRLIPMLLGRASGCASLLYEQYAIIARWPVLDYLFELEARLRHFLDEDFLLDAVVFTILWHATDLAILRMRGKINDREFPSWFQRAQDARVEFEGFGQMVVDAP